MLTFGLTRTFGHNFQPRGCVIVDLGAITSKAAWALADQYGDDMITVDPTLSTNFTLANGAGEWSLDMIAIPMSLEGVAGKVSFTRLDELGLTLLGMCYMHGIGRAIDFESGQHA